MAMRVWIDQDLCTGDGICVEISPAIFQMDDDGLAYVKEAGWADGFRIVLHATGDRYPNDSSVAQAIAQMWSRVGLKAEVEVLPGDFRRAVRIGGARSGSARRLASRA